MSEETPEAPIVVPLEQLPADVLDGLVEEFVSRDGTDYGAVERTLDEKKAAVLRQLQRGEVVVMFDFETESTTIVPADQAPSA